MCLHTSVPSVWNEAFHLRSTTLFYLLFIKSVLLTVHVACFTECVRRGRCARSARWIVGRRREQHHQNRSGTLVSGREAELKYLHSGKMAHGDVMSQAEDVADQVSSSPRGTRTPSRPNTGLRPGQKAEIFRCFRILFKTLKVERSAVVLDYRCCVAVNSADRLFVQTALCSGKVRWSLQRSRRLTASAPFLVSGRDGGQRANYGREEDLLGHSDMPTGGRSPAGEAAESLCRLDRGLTPEALT